jgi:ClpP class serine protease
MTKIYAMEMGYMTRLLSDRKDIMSLVKGWTADEMRAERAALIESCQVYVTPKTAAEAAKSYTVDDNGVAHIPIVGQLTPKAETDACGAYTAEALTEYGFIVAASQAADADEYVSSIEYYVDSPGGYVAGLMPAVKAMRDVSKPTTARVGGMAASAGYWLASQADKMIATSDISRFGSIGVAVEEYDNTKMLENAGITRRVYTSTDAPHKRPDTSTEEGRLEIVDGLDDLHRVFAGQVAEGRGVTIETVNADFGRGAVFTAQEAMRRGMIDSIETMPVRQKADSIGDVIPDYTAAIAEEKKQEVNVNTLDDLKKENSALYAEAVAVGEEAGVKKERERRNAIANVLKADPENANLKTVCAEAIQEGTSSSDMGFQTKVQVAIRDGAKLAGDNAPVVETSKDEEALSEDDMAAAKAAGMSIEDYKKYMPKEAK